MYDLCVIGHVTRDRLCLPDRPPSEMPGGVPHYAGLAAARLGLRTAVVTKAARCDRADLIGPLEAAGIAVLCGDSAASTVFENRYAAGDPDARSQRVAALAEPFAPADLEGVDARTFHLGPLTRDDMPPAFLAAVRARAARLSLDVQGFVRAVRDGAVVACEWPAQRAGLRLVDVLKADDTEARLLTGEADAEAAARALAASGPREVLITLGSRASLVFAEGRMHRIRAYPPRRAADPTGCGDSYCAGYLYARAKGRDVAAAGRFAAAVATFKLEQYGPFAGTAADVCAFLRGRETEDRSA